MNIRPHLLAVLCCGCLLLIDIGTAISETPDTGYWTRFHGADGAGYVADGSIPVSWTDADYSWRRSLDANDVGSPVVHGGRVYYLISKPEAERIGLESVDLKTGAVRWTREFAHPKHHLHNRNSFASSTPAVDEANVFVAWANPEHTYLKCFDHEGEELWSRDFGTWQSQHGFGTSPRIFGSLVLLLNSQQKDELKAGEKPGQSRMIAVDRNSGETVWETPLTTTRVCYGVPAIFEHNGTTQIIDAETGDGMFGLDAKTGKMLWNLKVFEMRICSSPLIVGDLAISSSGSGGGGNHLVAVRIPKSPGEQPEEVYRIERGAPYVPTAAVKGDRLFMIDDKGIASCVNALTGEELWFQRIGGSVGASPIVVGNVMLVISLDGKATTIKASDKFEELGSFDLGGPVGATPAYAEGRLLLRVGNELRCLGGKAL
jgi:outer membrane protein assembly factor BamB